MRKRSTSKRLAPRTPADGSREPRQQRVRPGTVSRTLLLWAAVVASSAVAVSSLVVSRRQPRPEPPARAESAPGTRAPAAPQASHTLARTAVAPEAPAVSQSENVSAGGVSVAFGNLTTGDGGSASSGVTVGFRDSASGAGDALSPGVSVAFQPGSTPTPTPSPTPTPTPTPSPQRRPLIFIPGVMGSRLDNFPAMSFSPNPLWPAAGHFLPSGLPLLGNPYLLNRNSRIAGVNVRATEAIRRLPSLLGGDVVYEAMLKALTDAGYTEYDLGGDPARLTTAGCNVGGQGGDKPYLFVFPYDWRLSNGVNAARLKDYVGCVRRFHPDAALKIDVVTHSMGGLLARSYLLQNRGDHQVGKLVTIAAPWLGAPKATRQLITGDFWDTRMDFVTRGPFKTLSEFFPSVHELMPSRAYFGLAGPPPPYILDGRPLSYDQTASLLDDRFGASKPGSAGRDFHGVAQDDWSDASNPVNTSVEYHHLYGVKTGMADTVGSVVENRRISCPPLLGCFRYDTTFEVARTAGDGTVPTLSALRPDALNAPGVSRATGRIKGFYCQVNCDHVGLLQNDEVKSEVVRILQSPPAAATNAAAQSSPASASVAADPEVQAAYYLTVAGAASALIQQNSSDGTNPLADPPDGKAPDITSYVIGDGSFAAMMPAGQTYSISLRAGAVPLTVELTQGDDLVTTQAIRYRDFSVPAGVALRLVITPQGADALRYDADGDGAFESAVEPKASVAGAAAQDTEPPAVRVSGAAQGAGLLVTVAASDADAGVKATYYSLDGTNFQPYTSPLTVDPYRPPVVYAFADDNVSNRSAVVAYYPSPTSNQIDNAQFFVRQHYRDFLGREPDASGLAFWTNEIEQCGADAACREVKRINVSAAFFLSIEFQETGYLAYRAHKAAFGDAQGKPVPVTREELLGEMRLLGEGVVIGQGDWRQRLEQNKRDFFDRLVTREQFAALYPQTMTPAQFVDALNAHAGGALSQSERDALVGELGGGVKTRAQALAAVAEDADLARAEFNRAFVLMQYFGYLRRNPDDPPDSDFAGWQFWLSKLNEFNGNFVQAEMVKAFISAVEYRQRFPSS